MKDIVIIGGGPAGYVGAIKAAKLNADVCIVEKDNFGGTCLNRGCIPTKTLYKTAEVLNESRRFEEFGLNGTEASIDPIKVQKRKDDIINVLRSGIQKLLKGNGISISLGEATIIDKNTVKVKNGEEEEIIKTKNIIIASGSSPEEYDIPGINNENVVSSDEILDLKKVPKSLVILGGGVIGMEFANIFSSFGSDVTVIVARDAILYDIDREVSKRYQSIAKRSGINILTGTVVKSIEKDGELILNCSGKKGDLKINAEMVLVAKGRKPNYSGLNLDELKINYDKKGIKVYENYQTSVKGIYAVGDVNGINKLAHAASDQAIKAVEHIILNKECKESLIPNCIFTFPEISYVGLTEEEAKEKNIKYKKSKFLFNANGKALTLGASEGFVKAICDEEDKIIGIHILGPHASDLILEGTLCCERGLKVSDLKEVVHAHPTLGEALGEAILALNGDAIHVLSK